jgi:glycosyltransferase involved in cell wall biosynthesis
LVLTSRIEGGANVLSEAIVVGTPVIASRIPSSEGILGSRYPGFFDVGDTRGLARRLARVERDPAQLRALARAIRPLRATFRPERERAAWKALIAELASDAGAGG